MDESKTRRNNNEAEAAFELSPTRRPPARWLSIGEGRFIRQSPTRGRKKLEDRAYRATDEPRLAIHRVADRLNLRAAFPAEVEKRRCRVTQSGVIPGRI